MASGYAFDRPEAWQRLTLLDMLLLQASFGLGWSLAFWPEARQAGGFERALAGTLLGAILAGPIILMIQWTLRRRSRPLSAGEWLWLSPSVLFGLFWLSQQVFRAEQSELGRHLLGFSMSAQVTCIGAALAILISGLRGYRDTVPCYWTDRTGNWVGLLSGFWIFFSTLPTLLAHSGL